MVFYFFWCYFYLVKLFRGLENREMFVNVGRSFIELCEFWRVLGFMVKEGVFGGLVEVGVCFFLGRVGRVG